MPTSLLPVFHDGILFERMGDILTDTFRANILRIMGYRTDVTQFVPIEHTAKNLIDPLGEDLTRWQHPGGRISKLETFWQVTPYLEKLLGESYAKYL
jgi:hypothetical protein